jgi:hypothetical protein
MLACHALNFERHFVAYKVLRIDSFVAELSAALQIRCTAKALINRNPTLRIWMLADGVRASQLQHPVQDMNAGADLGRPTLILARARPPSRARSPVTDDLLVATDGGLYAAPFVVAGHLLPPDPAFLGNALEMAVALGWLTRRR